MQLDECSVVFYNVYSLVRNQVRVSPMGDLIDLDYAAVLSVIRLHTETLSVADEVKETFERVLECFNIEREFTK